ncbi:MAG: serine dehydratase [Clostridia bacterium]|nr:serine dehydratase [Clostridia bacterium]
MKSLQELYRIGKGPSSSHTMAPYRAASLFAAAYPEAESFSAVLYGSLAKTGRGHLTDAAIFDGLAPRLVELRFDTETTGLPHPNTLDLAAYKDGRLLGSWRVLSVGGGAIRILGEPETAAPADIYALDSLAAIKQHCEKQRLALWQYVAKEEGEGIWPFLLRIWSRMKNTVYDGLETEGVLPGSLHVQRKAKYLYSQDMDEEEPATRANRLVCAYAYATAEQNAAGGIIVTAPTCGASGVMPAVLLYCQEKDGLTDEEIAQALATGGLIGNLIKTNASISGAECGCQAEIGSACSMAAAALAQLYGMDLDQIEYAAELSIEHHLGLTCDPICGLVQIPCIERNAVAAMRALDSLSLAHFLTHTRKISFDMVVQTMYETGRDLFSKYRETSEGGLAKWYHQQIPPRPPKR